jgi:hypothetical protein
VTSYLKLKRRRDALTYTIKNEHSKFNEVPVNKLIFKFFGREVSPEYMLLSTHGTDDLSELYEDTNFSFGRPKLLKLMKYKDFLPVNKYLNIFQETPEFA